METTFNLTCDAVIRRLERAIEDGTVNKAIADDIKALIDSHKENEDAKHRLTILKSDYKRLESQTEELRNTVFEAFRIQQRLKNSKHAISSTLKIILYTASGIAVTFFGAFIANMFNHI